MHFLLLSLLSFFAFTCCLSEKVVVQPRADTNDFLVRLILNISEDKVPDYLVGVIFDRPTAKGVSTEDVLQIFQFRNLTINTTLEVLQALNISSSRVFSLSGLNETLIALNWTFTNFYNSLTANIGLSGTPLRDALIALQIDVNNFSSGITWGDPDPWLEFSNGTFTQDSIRQATQAAGITEEQLFGGIKNLIENEVITWSIDNFVQLLVNYSIREHEAVIIWHTLNVTVEDVYNVELFRNILGNFSDRINNQTSLGILTNENNIYVQRKTYDLFEDEVELVNVYAETLLTNRVVTVNVINDTIYRNIVVLEHDRNNTTNLTRVEIGYGNGNLEGCEYHTLQNNSILSISIETAVFVNETFQIPRNTVNTVVLGSPLVCNTTVYGLARELIGQTIVLDAFEDFNASPGAESRATKSGSVFILFVVWALTQLLLFK